LGGLAAAQHGLVALEQVRLLGLSDSAVRKRVASGRLHRIHRGVYAVGRPGLAAPGRWLAAVMACGPGAALSHRSAAALLGLMRGDPRAPDVTTRNRSGRTLDGVTAHCDPRLSPDDLTAVAGIPCTTVPRTLLDLAASVDRQTLERAVEQAEVLRLFDGRALARVLADANGRHGGSRLRAVLAAAGDPTMTRSELERRFLALCRGAGLPYPGVNRWISLDGGGVEGDFVWAAERLVVETDGHGSHGTRRAFERDRRRDQRLVRAGWRVVRFTWRQVVEEPDEVAWTLAALVGR
jgi:hypothetical protein